jgi:RimJ/RimL family protein N-acetyltransferase
MKNERITIRSAIEKDIDVLCSWWADGKVMAHAGFPNGLETDKVKLLDRIVKQNREEYPNHQLLMIEIDGFKPIGEMNYRLVEEDVFEIGRFVILMNIVRDMARLRLSYYLSI